MRLPQAFDFYAIEVFLLTAELGGMTQSARHLGITQSAVSQIIAKLEAAVGANLFDRTLRPMALTTSGKALFDQGGKLVIEAKSLIGEIRDGSKLPIDTVTIAMAESVANQLTAPLIEHLGGRARNWRIRSGISQIHHNEFLARKFDMLITGSSTLENTPGIDHHNILDEPFILVLPARYTDDIGRIEQLIPMPFIRYSMLSGMGQRIERQMARMKVKLPNFMEVDSTFQQLTSVAAGLGWSITTPLCVAAHSPLLEHLRLAPMPRGQFSRSIQLVARTGDMGNLPAATAIFAQRYLIGKILPPLFAIHPWIEADIMYNNL